MATLVLTAVGTAVGGPIGGAIGALIGRSVDARVFRPATREGPRLTELAVQTSSYGTQIPKLFGAMRVAGTVIWSTDLIETRTTSGGSKGQPSSAAYSYSASFAVLLSARMIGRVGRIWAEGKLLRGAAGDWKATTAFRVHTGGEDQPVDPLIASAHPDTPAHRGCAYAVFEGLQLADFGNRIPSLTFEVFADEGPVAVGEIAAALADEVEGEVAQTLDGYAAMGASVAGVLDNLAMLAGAWWQPVGARLSLCDGAGERTVLADEAVTSGARSNGAGAARRTRSIAAAETVPRGVSVAHYDPARDYQTGVQQAVRPGPGYRSDRIELPALLTAEAARALADRTLAEMEAMRTRRTVSAGIDAIGLLPGSVIEITGEPGVWRARTVAIEGLVTRIDLVPVSAAPIPMPAPSGAVLSAPDRAIGATLLMAAEYPPVDDSILTTPRISVMATGSETGWRGAALLYSLDEGESWVSAGGIGVPSVLGVIEDAPGDGPTTIEGRSTTLTVVLARADMALEDADGAGIAQGRNLALVGEELVQFASAVPLGGARWRLSGLRRGVRGTGWATTGHVAGEAFAMIDRGAIVTIDVPMGSIGRSVRLLATGIGDVAGPVAAQVRVTGASVVPPSPVQVAASALPGGGWRLGWMRRSRSGWAWADGVDAPLVEETERYSVTLRPVAGSETVVMVDRRELILPTAPPGGTGVEIRQLGTHGASRPARFAIEEE
ncbi:MAG: phage tail protein [Sphingomonas bacterium]|nr:phage tail protein [Sphingomonas bacterium]